jgi:hypothetical protein
MSISTLPSPSLPPLLLPQALDNSTLLRPAGALPIVVALLARPLESVPMVHSAAAWVNLDVAPRCNGLTNCRPLAGLPLVLPALTGEALLKHIPPVPVLTFHILLGLAARFFPMDVLGLAAKFLPAEGDAKVFEHKFRGRPSCFKSTDCEASGEALR